MLISVLGTCGVGMGPLNPISKPTSTSVYFISDAVTTISVAVDTVPTAVSSISDQLPMAISRLATVYLISITAASLIAPATQPVPSLAAAVLPLLIIYSIFVYCPSVFDILDVIWPEFLPEWRMWHREGPKDLPFWLKLQEDILYVLACGTGEAIPIPTPQRSI